MAAARLRLLVKLLGISGSLQAGSANTALLGVARSVAPDDVELVVFDRIAVVPAFNPDTDPAPAEVDGFRSLVRWADALLFATPEYAFGLPGSLKNLLDWLVGSGELYEHPVAVVSAAPSPERGVHARADLERTLRAQGARVLVSTTIAVATNVRGREADDPEIRASIAKVLRALAEEA